jgi:hypothetical protein
MSGLYCNEVNGRGGRGKGQAVGKGGRKGKGKEESLRVVVVDIYRNQTTNYNEPRPEARNFGGGANNTNI